MKLRGTIYPKFQKSHNPKRTPVLEVSRKIIFSFLKLENFLLSYILLSYTWPYGHLQKVLRTKSPFANIENVIFSCIRLLRSRWICNIFWIWDDHGTVRHVKIRSVFFWVVHTFAKGATENHTLCKCWKYWFSPKSDCFVLDGYVI